MKDFKGTPEEKSLCAFEGKFHRSHCETSTYLYYVDHRKSVLYNRTDFCKFVVLNHIDFTNKKNDCVLGVATESRMRGGQGLLRGGRGGGYGRGCEGSHGGLCVCYRIKHYWRLFIKNTIFDIDMG